MKKQSLILAITITTIVLVSCSKERIETKQENINEEIATKPPGGNVVNINKNLEGFYQFNGKLNDQTGKLADAVPIIGVGTHGVIYTRDRKGNPNSAIQFTND